MPDVRTRSDVREGSENEERMQPRRKRVWTQIAERISYRGVVANLPYLMFLTLLCIVYITNNNRAISLTRKINERSKVLKELRWRYMDLQSRLMYQTTESQLKIRTEALGLMPLEQPPFEIRLVDSSLIRNN